MAKYYLGLDVHKVRTQYCLTDEAGEIVGEGNVATEAAASLADRDGLQAVLEATGNWCAVFDPLSEARPIASTPEFSRICSGQTSSRRLGRRPWTSGTYGTSSGSVGHSSASRLRRKPHSGIASA